MSKWTYILPEEVLQYITNIESQLAAKERQLEAALTDTFLHADCQVCPNVQSCKQKSQWRVADCKGFWRRRWEEQAK